MAQITSREELRDWLKDKPVKWAQVVAIRAALRALPYAFTEAVPQKWINDFAQLSVQMVAIRWIACNIPNYDMTTALRVIYKVAREADLANVAQMSSANAAANFCYSAIGAIFVGREPTTFFADAANVASHAAAAVGYGNTNRAASDGYAAADADIAWDNISADCAWLAASTDTITDAQRLARERLWPHGAPQGWGVEWLYGKARLLTLDRTYQVWIDWYNRRIEGHEAAFDIPGDADRAEDKAILVKLADAFNEDFWGKGATYINTALQSWIDEARQRVRPDETPDKPLPSTPEAIRAVAAEIASPSVILANGKLDVITNTTFDGQTDTANLDEAIAILRAVVAALLGGLPGNAPRSFAANLTIYDSELAKRDAKPFLGVLVRMEKSVSAGFHADPEMFDASVTTNFESYFDAHLEFMTHYRRNEERETKIAQFKIDDAAASGTALTGPVDEVVKEIVALAEQGLVTDGYAQAVKEQQDINTQIALYSSSLPTTNGEPTAKERHILQTVGFYERTLAIASNAITVAKPLIAFIKILKEAIEALLKFFV